MLDSLAGRTRNIDIRNMIQKSGYIGSCRGGFCSVWGEREKLPCSLGRESHRHETHENLYDGIFPHDQKFTAIPEEKPLLVKKSNARGSTLIKSGAA
jgi:hypothetical protein